MEMLDISLESVMCKQLLKSKPIFGSWHPYFIVGRTS